jgi:tetratricopeptide (TPR) repeat protein
MVLDRFLLGPGIALVAAAIVAGGLKGFGIEVPAVDSLPRQVLLGVFGALLMVLSLLVRTRDDHSAQEAAAEVVVPAVPVPGAVPRVTRYFTGREGLLAELQQTLQAEGLVTLTGLGGVGKTQLALAYLRQHRDEYGLVWWLRAEQPPTLAEDYAALADAKQLTGPSASTADKTAAASRWLQATDQRWLSVFDNATDAETVRPYLPSDTSRGQVIVTSRDQLWPELATIEVKKLDPAESLQFLSEHTPSDPGTAVALAELLGDLPLALEQARAYLAATRRPAAAYLQDLQRQLATRSGELLGAGTPAHYQATVATTWALSIRQARREAPGAGELLTLLAFLAPEAIPRSLPAEHPGTLPRRLRRVAADPGSYERAVGALARYSLLTLTQDALTVHRLVQAVAHQPFSARVARRWAAAAVRLLEAAFPDDVDDVRNWPACALLLPHALTAAEHAGSLQADVQATAGLLNQVGTYLWWRAEVGQARRLFQRAQAVLEARLGPDHPDVGRSLNNLGNALRGLGDLRAALHAHQRAQAILQARLGPDHPDVGRSLNNLGGVLGGLGELPAALDAHQRARAILDARLGPDHPDAASSLDNLGIVLRRLGELDAARDAHQRALAIREAQLGADHPDVARSLDNLGIVLRRLGNLDAARDAHQHALAIREAQLGADHPHVAHALSSLGSVAYELGELPAARTSYEHALRILEARLGPNHPDVASYQGNLGNVLRGLGDLAAARTAFERARAIFETRLGPDHPDVAQTQESLETVLSELDAPPAVRAPHRRVLPVFEPRIGSGNPLATTIPRNSPAVVPALAPAPEPPASDH